MKASIKGIILKYSLCTTSLLSPKIAPKIIELEVFFVIQWIPVITSSLKTFSSNFRYCGMLPCWNVKMSRTRTANRKYQRRANFDKLVFYSKPVREIINFDTFINHKRHILRERYTRDTIVIRGFYEVPTRGYTSYTSTVPARKTDISRIIEENQASNIQAFYINFAKCTLKCFHIYHIIGGLI